MSEQVDVGEVIAVLQQTIANQALELAKAQVLINTRNRTIQAQQVVIDTYEKQHAERSVAAGNGGGFDVVGDRQP